MPIQIINCEALKHINEFTHSCSQLSRGGWLLRKRSLQVDAASEECLLARDSDQELLVGVVAVVARKIATNCLMDIRERGAHLGFRIGYLSIRVSRRC